MNYRVTMRHKETGEGVEDATVKAQDRGTNYKAMISWRGIVKIEHGDSLEAAVQNAFDKFSGLGVLSGYDIELVSSN